VLLIKPLAALIIVIALRYPAKTALTVAIGLAQIGEFSFILGEVSRKQGLVGEEAMHLLVACAIVSITLNPMLFKLVAPAEAWLRRHPRTWAVLNGRSEARARAGNDKTISHVAGHAGPLAVVVGYGPVGRQVDRLLRDAGMDTVIIDLNMDVVAAINADGEDRRSAIFGDATSAEISTPHAADSRALIAAAKDLNPKVRLLVRTRYLREEATARQHGADAAVVDEVESGVALSELVLAETGVRGAKAKTEADRVRYELTSVHRPSHA
jgi:CPA2 family monovalent cation:H+ antiporter-2